MPRMSNGIGTWFCTAHFNAGWGWDDAVECAMFVFFPVWPHRVVHLLEVPGGSFAPDKYQAIPLRWSEGLVRHVFLRRWLAGFIGLGMFIGLMVAFVTISPPTGPAAKEWAVTKPIFTLIAPCLVVAGIVGLQFLRPRARRERDIRRVVGLHALGSSDPATWVDDDLARFPKPDALFGTATYAEAVPKLLDAGALTGAMWAARLTVVSEGEANGESLTDEVLRHPGTREALVRFRRDKSCWPSAMGAQALAEYQASLPRPDEQGPAEGGP